ncbi:MAG: hypothetical protein ABI877_22155, partial [Gemmatimonadaceae bacterium]
MTYASIRSKRALRVFWVLIAVTVACADESSLAPEQDPGATMLNGERGDAQISTVGTELPIPLTLKVRSKRGTPLKGLRVTWGATDGGGVQADQKVTDDSGMVHATWTLGLRAGRQNAVA